MSSDFSAVEDRGSLSNFFPIAEGREARLLLDCTPAFFGGASFGLPLVMGVFWACCSEDCVDSGAAPISWALESSLFFPSCSNGDPFSIDPNGDVSPSRAGSPETAATAFGFVDSIAAVSFSEVELGLSAEGTPFVISDFC